MAHHEFPWFAPSSESQLTPEETLRFQVETAQSEEIAHLRLVNEFLRAESGIKAKAVAA